MFGLNQPRRGAHPFDVLIMQQKNIIEYYRNTAEKSRKVS